MIQRSNSAESTASPHAQALTQVPPSLRDVASQSLAFLLPRLEQVFRQTNDHLFVRAEAAESMEDRRLLFEIAQVLGSQRDAAIDAFATEFLAGFVPASPAAAKKGAGSRPSGELGGVGVLNGDAFELSVAVSTVTSRSANQHKAYIDRLTPALGGSKTTGLSSRRNPLSVFRITGAFMTAIGALQLDAAVQRVLLDEFEREVIDGLGAMYGDVCRTLQLDVVDDDSNDTADDPNVPVREEEGSYGLTDSHDSVRPGAGFGDLRRLLHPLSSSEASIQPGEGASSAGQGGGPAVSPAQLLEALSGIHPQASPMTAGQPLDLNALVGAALASRGVELGQVDELAQDTLQLVSLLFEHILRDEDISIPLASLIARLQIPVLKVAIVDQSVFDDSDHVVRKVINRLADIGIGWWGDTDQVREDPLFRAIDGIVTRIVDDCHENGDVFADADEELETVIARSTNRAQNLERRLTEREAGKAKVEAARKAVQDLINTRASGLRLPDGIGRFIGQAWTQVMVYLCVRHGAHSDEWQDAGETLDELLKLGQPAAREPDVAHRSERLPFLFERIEHWLHLAGFHTSQAEGEVRALYQGFEELSEHDRLWFENDSSYEVHELGEMEVVELVESPAADALVLDAELESWLASLRPGVWIEFMTAGQPGHRCRLSMVFEQSRNHLFVDHRGLKVCELTAAEVAEAFRDGRIRELKADPVVERALDDMISDLRASIREGSAAS